MQYPIKTEEHRVKGKLYRIAVYQDTDPTNPRENLNLGKMVCLHRRLELGDKHEIAKGARITTPEQVEALIGGPLFIRLPLYLMDHSGLRMSTAPFGCKWDSGQVGFIYCSWKDARVEFEGMPDTEVEEKTKARFRIEVDEYDAYLAGNYVGYRIERKRTKRDPECSPCKQAGKGKLCPKHTEEWIEDSIACWGFHEVEAALEQARAEVKAA